MMCGFKQSLFTKTYICKIRSMEWKETMIIRRSTANQLELPQNQRKISKCVLNIQKVSKDSKISKKM